MRMCDCVWVKAGRTHGWMERGNSVFHGKIKGQKSWAVCVFSLLDWAQMQRVISSRWSHYIPRRHKTRLSHRPPEEPRPAVYVRPAPFIGTESTWRCSNTVVSHADKWTNSFYNSDTKAFQRQWFVKWYLRFHIETFIQVMLHIEPVKCNFYRVKHFLTPGQERSSKGQSQRAGGF